MFPHYIPMATRYDADGATATPFRRAQDGAARRPGKAGKKGSRPPPREETCFVAKVSYLTWSIHAGTDWPAAGLPAARARRQSVDVHLHRTSVQSVTYAMEAAHGDLVSKASVAVGDVVVNQSVTPSPPLVLAHWRSDKLHPRDTHQPMLHLRIATFMPSPERPEHAVRARCLPVRCLLDQDVLAFVSGRSAESGAEGGRGSGQGQGGSAAPAPYDPDPRDDASPPPAFIRSCDIRPCKLKIDYKPVRVDLKALREGNYVEVLNLLPLEGVEIRLQAVESQNVGTFGDLVSHVCGNWVHDISSEQLHKFLCGAPAIRPLTEIGAGLTDMVILSADSYRDRRIMRGLKKGSTTFLQKLSLEALNGAHRIARSATLSVGEIVDGTAPSIAECVAAQPAGLAEGLSQAGTALGRGLKRSARTIVAIPVQYKRDGARTVVRAVPIAVLAPIHGALGAVDSVATGLRNAIGPAMREEEGDVWLTPPRPAAGDDCWCLV